MIIKNKSERIELLEKHLIILLLIPLLAISYALISGKYLIPIITVALGVSINTLLMHFLCYQTGKRSVLFELSDTGIYHAFAWFKKPQVIDLNQVDSISYGKDYIAFKGSRYYAKEIFFPVAYRAEISRIVTIITQRFRHIQVNNASQVSQLIYELLCCFHSVFIQPLLGYESLSNSPAGAFRKRL